MNSNTLCHYCIDYELKVKLLIRVKSISTVYKTRISEIQYLQSFFQMKTGTDCTGIIRLYYLITGREEALVENKKEIELLQQKISLTSIRLLMEQKAAIPSMYNSN